MHPSTETTPLVHGKDDLSEEEMFEFLQYPGGFLCGRTRLRYCIQGPQCCVGIFLVAFVYLPTFLVLWLTSCLHGYFCECCCPVLVGDPPEDQYELDNEETLGLLSTHSRRFFTCCLNQLMSTRPSCRWPCCRCCYHFVCCCHSIDYFVNIRKNRLYLKEMRNDFGDVFPVLGVVGVGNFETAVELVAGKDCTRHGVSLLVGGQYNAVMTDGLKLQPNLIGNEHPEYTVRREIYNDIFADCHERMMRMSHGRRSGRVLAYGDEMTGADLLEKCRSFVDNREMRQSGEIDFVTLAGKHSVQILFFMLTGGELAEEELVYTSSGNPLRQLLGPFFDNYMLFYTGGYGFLRSAADMADTMNHALLRYPNYYRPLVVRCRELGLNVPDIFRVVGTCASMAGKVTMQGVFAQLLPPIMADPEKELSLFETNRLKYVSEAMRVSGTVHRITTHHSLIKRTFMSGGREVIVHEDDRITANLTCAETDAKKTGTHSMDFDATHVTNSEYRETLGLAWMGPELEFSWNDQTTRPIRGCPGKNVGHWLVAFLIGEYDFGGFRAQRLELDGVGISG